jgi:hypothetical protein
VCNIDNIKNSPLSMIKRAINGNNIKLIIADKPEILFNVKTKTHINITINPSFKFIAKRKPKEVATPLPPMNRLNMENICPARMKNAARYNIVGSKSTNTYIGIKPFRKSPMNVNIPARGPATLYIFVAPGFFDPNSLGSFVDNKL